MRMTTILSVGLGAMFSLVAAAQADAPPYTVSTSGGNLVVTAGTGYHINTEYPWKVIDSSTPPNTLADKSKFTITTGSATLNGAPKGSNTLKGAYCSVTSTGAVGACTPFATPITVP